MRMKRKSERNLLMKKLTKGDAAAVIAERWYKCDYRGIGVENIIGNVT